MRETGPPSLHACVPHQDSPRGYTAGLALAGGSMTLGDTHARCPLGWDSSLGVTRERM